MIYIISQGKKMKISSLILSLLLIIGLIQSIGISAEEKPSYNPETRIYTGEVPVGIRSGPAQADLSRTRGDSKRAEPANKFRLKEIDPEFD